MSREDTYTDSCAISSNAQAKRLAERMEREVGFDWDESPDLCDLWRMYKFSADLEEAHSKMIHGNIATRSGVPDLNGDAKTLFMDEITEANNRLKEITEEWCQIKWKMDDITNKLAKNQSKKDEEKREVERAEYQRQKEIQKLLKAARLGF